jgi:hypothetical protein
LHIAKKIQDTKMKEVGAAGAMMILEILHYYSQSSDDSAEPIHTPGLTQGRQLVQRGHPFKHSYTQVACPIPNISF